MSRTGEVTFQRVISTNCDCSYSNRDPICSQPVTVKRLPSSQCPELHVSKAWSFDRRSKGKPQNKSTNDSELTKATHHKVRICGKGTERSTEEKNSQNITVKLLRTKKQGEGAVFFRKHSCSPEHNNKSVGQFNCSSYGELKIMEWQPRHRNGKTIPTKTLIPSQRPSNTKDKWCFQTLDKRTLVARRPMLDPHGVMFLKAIRKVPPEESRERHWVVKSHRRGTMRRTIVSVHNEMRNDNVHDGYQVRKVTKVWGKGGRDQSEVRLMHYGQEQ